MNIFIGWSGERSRHVASALRDWIPNVIQAARPWMSTEDIDKGVRWRDKLFGVIDRASMAIICLTKENLSAPWVYFEAGAIAKHIQGSRLFIYALDVPIDHSIGPLAEFQATNADRDDTFRLLVSMNSAIGANLSEQQLKAAFESQWGKLEHQLTIARRLTVPIDQTEEKTDIEYESFFNEFLAAHAGEQRGSYKQRQLRVRRLCKKLSQKHFRSARPPAPKDPVIRTFFDRVEPFSLALRCKLCRVDCRPDREGCCPRCGLFCTFWAIRWKKSTFKALLNLQWVAAGRAVSRHS